MVYNQRCRGVIPADSLIDISMKFGREDNIHCDIVFHVWGGFVDIYVVILRRQSVLSRACLFCTRYCVLTIALPPNLAAMSLNSLCEHCCMHRAWTTYSTYLIRLLLPQPIDPRRTTCIKYFVIARSTNVFAGLEATVAERLLSMDKYLTFSVSCGA
jgi:hypothetical protein